MNEKIPLAKSKAEKNVGIWIRVSTEDQAKGESPEHHEARAREYAKFNGWTVKEIYDLSGVSGKTVMEHAEAKRMIEDIKGGRIQGLLFSKLARLARNTKELLEFADFFREYNADMISLQEKIDTSSPAGRLFYTLIAALSQWEREEIADRVKASINIRAKLGKNLGGAASYGYMWEDNKLVIDPEEAPVRKLIYELFAEHKRMKGVARILNEKGYRTRNGSRFTDTTILRLIQDTSAKGMYRANHTYRDSKGKLHLKPESEWVYTPVPPIIPEELWNTCNDLLKARKNGKPPGPTPVHLFAGLLHCGCGKKMYVFSRTSKYICSKCRTKIPMEDIEAIFRDELHDYFVSEEKIKERLKQADQHIATKRAQLENHTRELEKIRSEMRKVYQLYQSDQISPEGFGKLYRPLEDQERSLAIELPKLQGELDALEMRQLSAAEVITEASNLYRTWPELTAEDKRKIIESITEKIVITGDEIDITLSYTPSSEELTKRQRNLCAMLPCCELVLHVSRSKYLPSHIRGIQVPKEPKTIGEHLRRRRLELKLQQSEAAQKLSVSTVTLSRWECDKVYPTWEQQPKVIEYLGYNPFTDPALGRPKGNESIGIAILSSKDPDTIGDQIKRHRLKMQKNQKQFAKELGVTAKTLRGWETNRHRPFASVLSRLSKLFGFQLGLSPND